MSDAAIGVIGGSGVYQMQGLTVVDERRIETPFGEPSDAFVIGEVDGVRVAFLARHGGGHRVLPNEINYRANIYGLKTLGVHTILSASAVGSMKEAYEPTDMVFPHQFIDRTRHRPDTFFGNGIVGHVAFADPICAGASMLMATSAGSAAISSPSQRLPSPGSRREVRDSLRTSSSLRWAGGKGGASQR